MQLPAAVKLRIVVGQGANGQRKSEKSYDKRALWMV